MKYEHDFDPYYLTSDQRLDIAKLLMQHAVERGDVSKLVPLVQLVDIIQHKISNIDDTFEHKYDGKKNKENKNKI